MRGPLLIAAVLVGACSSSANERAEVRPTGQRSFDVGAFERISLAGSQNVVVRVGPAPSVRAEGDADALERLDIGVEDG